MSKVGIILFNLGGPDRPDSVEPFLFNLFSDPAIIALPQPFRWVLAKLISKRRAPVARAIYGEIGGKSPLLDNTAAQGAALAAALAQRRPEVEFRCFPTMRYWHPMSAAVAHEVRSWDADRVILLPLYPQYSTTTTGSSLSAWRAAARAAELSASVTGVCCYPSLPGFVDGLASRTRRALTEAGGPRAARVLFSAHGLPRKVIAAGDPYQWQVERTAAAVVEALAVPGLDWRLCYQSRVGPLEWIGPSTEDEVRRAGDDGKALAVVPVAFVSEHSETLVELDIEYRRLAGSCGVPRYVRAPTVSTDPGFIEGLADLVEAALSRGGDLVSAADERLCPGNCGRCALA